jgi:hypothetical protein
MAFILVVEGACRHYQRRPRGTRCRHLARAASPLSSQASKLSWTRFFPPHKSESDLRPVALTGSGRGCDTYGVVAPTLRAEQIPPCFVIQLRWASVIVLRHPHLRSGRSSSIRAIACNSPASRWGRRHRSGSKSRLRNSFKCHGRILVTASRRRRNRNFNSGPFPAGPFRNAAIGKCRSRYKSDEVRHTHPSLLAGNDGTSRIACYVRVCSTSLYNGSPCVRPPQWVLPMHHNRRVIVVVQKVTFD